MTQQRHDEMDQWSDEQVAEFKERARYRIARPAARNLEEKVAETIVAEGDSWFDYLPGTDLIDCLRAHHGYVIDNYANAGDTLENMVYGTRIDSGFNPVAPTIGRVMARIREIRPKVFLFSGGGNDIAGDEFASYLNHQASGLPAVRNDFIDYMIGVVFRKCFEDLIAKVREASPDTHLVAHGYGRTAPTGKGVRFLFFRFAGPWLKPALAGKGIVDPATCRQAVFALIDRYNDMLASLAAQHDRFHHVDLRDLLNPDTDWSNELHLRNSAYARAADRLHELIKALP